MINVLYLLIFLCVLVNIVGVVVLVVARWKIRSDEKQREVNLKMAEAQSLMMSVKPFKELMETLNSIMDFRIANEMVLVISGPVVKGEREELLTNYTAAISADVFQSMSPELKRQFSCYVEVNPDNNTDDYLKYYIRKTVMTKLTIVIDKRMKVVESDKAASKSNTQQNKK